MSVHLSLQNHVVACDAEVDVTLADERRDVGGGEEDTVCIEMY